LRPAAGTPRAALRAGAVLLAAAALLAGGCASVPARSPVGAGAGAATPAAPASVPAAELAAAWTVPADELASQRLFRVTYDGADGGGSFRLTLLLESAQRYQVRAVDPLGRALWTLDVAGDEGRWLDHRNRVTCRLHGRFDLAAAHLAPFPLGALPALLLGRLPAAADGSVEVTPAAAAGDLRIAYRDARGRGWSARLVAGRPTSWTLVEGGEASLWWLLHDGEAFLSDPGRGSQLRWRQTLREPLAAAIASPPVPDGYDEVDCGLAYDR